MNNLNITFSSSRHVVVSKWHTKYVHYLLQIQSYWQVYEKTYRQTGRPRTIRSQFCFDPGPSVLFRGLISLISSLSTLHKANTLIIVIYDFSNNTKLRIHSIHQARVQNSSLLKVNAAVQTKIICYPICCVTSQESNESSKSYFNLKSALDYSTDC